MQVKLIMDGAEGPLTVDMIRSQHPQEKPWLCRIETEGKSEVRQMTDNQAAATVALACGINRPENDPTERELYAMVGDVFDGLALDLRPIP